MNEYHKIETLFERDPKTFKVYPDKLRHPVYGIIKTWQFTEKIDGTNIRVIWKEGKLSFGGKTDSAQIHADLIKHLYELVDPAKLAEKFPGGDVVIYGEGYGAGIQKGGGAYSQTKRFILFDVLVDGKWWLDWANTCDVATFLGLDTVPYIGELTLEDAVERTRAGFPSALAARNGQHIQAEGMVGRPIETLFDKKGSRIIIKLKTKDF